MKEELLQRAIDGTDFLASLVKPSGKFIYGYKRPNSSQHIKGYNILRHAGCVWALLTAYETIPNKEYLKKSKLALDWMIKNHIQSYKDLDRWDDNVSMVVENGQVKLGGNALAILALMKYNSIRHNVKYEYTSNKLAEYISLFCTTGNGMFMFHKKDVKYDVAIDFVSEFYPGEAALALCQFNGHYHYILDKIFNYHFRLREAMGHIRDHWMMQALESSGMGKRYMKYADAIVYEEIRSGPSHKSCAAACRSEGMLSYLTFEINKDKTKTIKKYLEEFIKFQMSMQIMKKRYKGGFIWSSTNEMVRCDASQHNICSFLRYYKMLNEEE